MKKLGIAGLCVLFLFSVVIAIAQEMPEMPKPVKQHEWLQQLVGEWETECEVTMKPGEPPQKSKGTESVRALGGFWIISEIKGDMMGDAFTGISTLGYDPEKKSFVGTWVDSFGSYLWHYKGSLDSAEKILTLEADGPSFAVPGKLSKFKDKIEIKSKDHMIFSSSMQQDDGSWMTFMTMHCNRKK